MASRRRKSRVKYPDTRRQYDPQTIPAEMEDLCRRGLPERSMKGLAQYLGVAYQTFQAWWNKYDELRAAVERGRQEHDRAEAEQALQRVITGEWHWTQEIREKTVTRFDSNGNPRQVTESETTYRQHYQPPNEKAIMAFLQARFPERWPSPKAQVDVRAKHQHQHQHQHDVNINLEDFSTDELREFQQYLERIESGAAASN